jgi:hypothetical protein
LFENKGEAGDATTAAGGGGSGEACGGGGGVDGEKDEYHDEQTAVGMDVDTATAVAAELKLPNAVDKRGAGKRRAGIEEL